MGNSARQIKGSCNGCWALGASSHDCLLNYRLGRFDEQGKDVVRPLEWCPKPLHKWKLIELSAHIGEEGYDKHGVPLAQGSGGGTGGFE